MPIAISKDKIYLSSEKKTEEIKIKVLAKHKKGNVLFFDSEMRVEKTTFIRYLINGFQNKIGTNLTEVTSPTFNLMNEYEIDKLKIKHFDLFRVNSEKELKNLDIFGENIHTITLIEWPQLIKKKPANLIELFFNYEEDHQKRSVKVRGLNF